MNFLDLPQRGKTGWWRYAIGIVLVQFFWLGIGSLPLAALGAFVEVDGDPATTMIDTSFVGIDSMLPFTALNLSFIFLLLGLWLVVRFLHKRPFQTLITPYKSISWRRVGAGFGIYFALTLVTVLIEYAMSPDNFAITLDLSRLIPFALLILIFTPLQTSAEELLFRGYLMQGAGHFTHNIWVLSILSGVLFTLPHLANPEVQIDPILLPLNFFVIGFFWAFITLRDNRMELALGAHAANNMFIGIFVNYTDAAMETGAVFTQSELNPAFSLAAVVISSILFYFAAFQPWKSAEVQVEA